MTPAWPARRLVVRRRPAAAARSNRSVAEKAARKACARSRRARSSALCRVCAHVSDGSAGRSRPVSLLVHIMFLLAKIVEHRLYAHRIIT
jgi:hypothetical protein